MNRREAIAALISLPASARISVASLQPDDVIVVETQTHLLREEYMRIEMMLRRVWPHRRVIVLDRGLALKVVSAP